MPGDENLAGMLVPHALRAIEEGTSANRWIQALKEAGIGIRRQDALRLYGQARTLAREYGAEPTRPLNQVPRRSEMKAWPTRGAEGVLQTVRLFYRERVTHRIVDRFYNVKTPAGVTREEAVRLAINANADNAERYQQDLLSAVHTGSALLVADEAA